MKTLLLRTATLSAALMAMAFTVHAGKRIETSQLPQQAITFIHANYQGIGIDDCEIDGGIYEVDMTNGVDIEFNSAGKIMKIDGGRHLIENSVLKAILPAATYNDLTTRKVIGSVE